MLHTIYRQFNQKGLNVKKYFGLNACISMTYVLKRPGKKPYFRGLGDWMDKKLEKQAKCLPLIALELLFRLVIFF
jgi:hypothetical protein